MVSRKLAIDTVEIACAIAFVLLVSLERETGIEPATSSLGIFLPSYSGSGRNEQKWREQPMFMRVATTYALFFPIAAHFCSIELTGRRMEGFCGEICGGAFDTPFRERTLLTIKRAAQMFVASMQR
jgi:hypothetical protein